DAAQHGGWYVGRGTINGRPGLSRRAGVEGTQAQAGFVAPKHGHNLAERYRVWVLQVEGGANGVGGAPEPILRQATRSGMLKVGNVHHGAPGAVGLHKAQAG